MNRYPTGHKFYSDGFGPLRITGYVQQTAEMFVRDIKPYGDYIVRDENGSKHMMTHAFVEDCTLRMGIQAVIRELTCRDCGRLKTALCPVCHGAALTQDGCVWCGLIGAVCPDGPHFRGFVNR